MFNAMFSLHLTRVTCMICLFAVREESSFVNSIKESSNDESLNHSNDSAGSTDEIAEFSDEEDVPAGKLLTSSHGEILS